MTDNKKFLALLGGAAVGLIYLCAIIILQVYSNTQINPEEQQMPDYSAAKSFKEFVLVNNQKSYFDKEIIGGTEKMLKQVGKIGRGYLYIEASIDGKKLTSYDSVFVKLDDRGGHILRNKSLPTPLSEKTQLLYTLRNIPYLSSVPYDETRQGRNANWEDRLNSNRPSFFQAFLSTERRTGLLEKISIKYECDPSSPDCSIEWL